MRRSKLEISIDVLEVIQNGEAKPTRIMYQSNLSYSLLKNTLNSLVEQGLILEIEPSSRRGKRDGRTNTVYHITPKGKNVLQYFQNSRTLIQVGNSKPLQASI